MNKDEFKNLTDELIAAIREGADAHTDAMESDSEDVNRRYLEAVDRFEELDRRWREAFKPLSGAEDKAG